MPTLADLHREQDLVLDLLRRSYSLEAGVPHCSGWTVRDLAVHVAAVHRWAALAAALPPDTDLPDEPPARSTDPVADYAAAAAELRAALAENAARPCATFVGPATGAWWLRRQLHETLVHRLDLQAALGQAPTGPAPGVAADGIAEVVEVLHPRQVRLGRTTAPAGSVRLQGGSGSWTLGEGTPLGTVVGADLALLQLLWRRTGPDDTRLRLSGPDVAGVRRLLGQALTP